MHPLASPTHQEVYFTSDGVTDMFWANPLNLTSLAQHCLGKYGIQPRTSWIRQQYGSLDQIAAGASNIGERVGRERWVGRARWLVRPALAPHALSSDVWRG
jgi:hypothetical protein